jgi:hypothetical protein
MRTLIAVSRSNKIRSFPIAHATPLIADDIEVVCGSTQLPHVPIPLPRRCPPIKSLTAIFLGLAAAGNGLTVEAAQRHGSVSFATDGDR